MSKWQEKRLGEVAEINPESISNKNFYNTISYVDISSVKEGILYGVCNYSINNAPERAKRILRNNDIIISTVRPNLKAYYFVKNDMPNLICSTGFAILRAKNTTVSRFLYYVISNDSFINYLSLVAKGSAYPAVDKKDFINAKINIPDLATQEKIADILSTYDDLIENNNRRIEILEQMAQEIYKEWFVRFRFPGHEKIKFINGLPEGWEVKKIKDFGNIITGKTPSTEVYENYGKDIMFIKTPDMHDTVFTTYSSEYLSEKGHLTQANKLIPANSILVSCIGTAGIVSINAEVAHTNQQINSIVLNDENLLYWLFYSCRFLKNTIELYGATGATMTNLSKGKFENLKILMPKQELVYLYNNKVNNIFSHIKTLLYFNQNLIKQRDLLLPRLMSGKLEV